MTSKLTWAEPSPFRLNPPTLLVTLGVFAGTITIQVLRIGFFLVRQMLWLVPKGKGPGGVSAGSPSVM